MRAIGRPSLVLLALYGLAMARTLIAMPEHAPADAAVRLEADGGDPRLAQVQRHGVGADRAAGRRVDEQHGVVTGWQAELRAPLPEPVQCARRLHLALA